MKCSIALIVASSHSPQSKTGSAILFFFFHKYRLPRDADSRESHDLESSDERPVRTLRHIPAPETVGEKISATMQQTAG